MRSNFEASTPNNLNKTLKFKNRSIPDMSYFLFRDGHKDDYIAQKNHIMSHIIKRDSMPNTRLIQSVYITYNFTLHKTLLQHDH